MKSDLNRLMEEKGFDAILITGSGQHNPAMVYLTGGGHMTSADVIMVRGNQPVLFHNPMERDEAKATGLRTKNLVEYNWKELMKEAEGDSIKAQAFRYQKMLADIGINQGKIAVYGNGDVGINFAVFSTLETISPGIQIIGEPARNSLILEAMKTKQSEEIERIRKMGKVTTAVVGKVADYLTSQRVKGEILITADGEPLTVREVKRKINLWLVENGVENPHGTIFAIGHDAGVPHSTGNPDDFIALGRTIVFDIFPCELGGGYHYDFTRTWCLGYAPDEAQALYEDVLKVYMAVVNELTVGEPFTNYQDMTCDLFETLGHQTIKSDLSIEEGYVHSLGHGVGLHIHEAPWSGIGATEKDTLDPGSVFTIEPGLYYPSKGMGCRLEDTFTITKEGEFKIIAEYPLDLVLPLK